MESNPARGSSARWRGRQSELFGALGYLSLDVRARRPSRELPHPRDYVSLIDILAQGQSAFNAGRFDRALELYARCAELSPGTALFHDYQGKTCLKLRRFDDAARHYERALAIHPEMTDTRLALGFAHVNGGRPAEAEAAFREVMLTRPGLHKGYAYLANLLRTQGRNREAAEIIDAMLDRAPPPDPREAEGFRREAVRLRGAGG